MIPMVRALETENRYLRATGQIATTQSMVNSAARQIPTMGELLSDTAGVGGAGVSAELPGQRDARIADEERFRFEAAQLTTAMETASDEDLPAIRDRLYALEDARQGTLDAAVKAQLAAGRIVSPAVLAEKYPEVTFDRPMSWEEARLLSESRRAEMVREAIIAAGPTGFVSGVQKFGNSLLAMASDPLEVATMFIPVVGAGGKALAVARLGRVGGRVAVGAVEGGVGNALTEPLYAGLSRSMQMDYTMADSLLNIGAGFVLGGGIGTVAGVLARGAGEAPGARSVAEGPEAARADDTPPAATTGGAAVEPPGAAPLALREEWRGRAETMRLADEQRPVAETALRQMATGQSVNIAPVMPRWSAQDALAELNREMFRAQKYPLASAALARGVDPTSDLGKELAHAGLTNRTIRGLFKTDGLRNLDNLVASEYESRFPGISEIAGVPEVNGVSTGYLSEDGLVQAIVSEIAGRDIGIPNRTTIKASMGTARADVERLTEVYNQAKAAGLHLQTEEEVRFAADLMARGVPAERLADTIRPEVALAEHVKTDVLADDTYSAEIDAYVPQSVQDEIADLERMIAQMSEADAFDMAADLSAIKATQDRARVMTDAVNAAITCMARQ